MAVNEEKLLKELTKEDLQEQHQEFAEVIGVENLIKLSNYFGGTSIYIPQRRELVKLKVYGMIKAEYNGTNIKELAGKYDVSESTV
ncbi:MAG: Mor transcription activator family protein, partial [Acetatifactor sp.]